MMVLKLIPQPEESLAAGSAAARMRARRFAYFAALLAHAPKPLTILDIGGTTEFWETHGWAGRSDVRITLVNLAEQETRHANICARLGDATDLTPFADRSFDVVFSNSVIEHLSVYRNQERMAREVRRLGRAYWVQTPNYWFPLEPHFLVPGWQWLPLQVRIAIIRRHRCGWRGRTQDPIAARNVVGEVRLLTRRELAGLFPEARLVPERFWGLTKSWIAIHGFDALGCEA